MILWPDTFNNYFFPDTAIAAAKVLRPPTAKSWFQLPHFCCGRPLYDYGFLDMAKDYLRRILAGLGKEIDRGTPMVVLEPSCCSVFRDELTNLFPGAPESRKAETTNLHAGRISGTTRRVRIADAQAKSVVHGHCHHKAVMRMKAEESLFKKMGLDYEMLDSGCCGMAGSFGFEVTSTMCRLR